MRTYVKRLRRKLGDEPQNPPPTSSTKRRVGFWMERGEG